MQKKKWSLLSNISKPIRGVASVTGSISPTMVAKIVIDSIMVTPAMQWEPGLQKCALEWCGIDRYLS